MHLFGLFVPCCKERSFDMYIFKRYTCYEGKHPLLWRSKTAYSTQSRNWVQWVCNIGPSTCSYCADHHGHILSPDDADIIWPPVHPHCRCQIAPVPAFPAGTATEDGANGIDCFLFLYGALPENYITQDEAKQNAWSPSAGNLWDKLPGAVIGGQEYLNVDGQLPSRLGRTWYEADFDYHGGYRNGKRILFSNDGLMFVTYDHYVTFSEVYWEGEYYDHIYN